MENWESRICRVMISQSHLAAYAGSVWAIVEGERKELVWEQIISVLKEVEAGAKTPDLCRRYGITEQTFYRWKSKYGGLEVSEGRRLRQLEDENRKLSTWWRS